MKSKVFCCCSNRKVHFCFKKDLKKKIKVSLVRGDKILSKYMKSMHKLTKFATNKFDNLVV